MGVRKRITAVLLVIIMLLSNLSFPLQSVVYGFGEGNNESKAINFHGEHLTVNNDGSVTFDCNLENNEGRITFAVFNSENERMYAEAQLMWSDEQNANVPNERDAWLDLQTESYEGCYVIVTSDGNVDLSQIKLDIAGHMMFIDQEGRVDLPSDVEHINIDEGTVRSLYEKKQVRFEGDNLEVSANNKSVTLDCTIEGNEGRLTFELYNSDKTQVDINRRTLWNDETQQEEPNDREAEGILNTTTYEGAYLVVTSDGNVDLSDVMFDFAGRMCQINANRKVYLPADLDDIVVDEHSMREAIEKKRVDFEEDNLQVNNDGTVTLDCNLKNNTGKITLTLYNSNDTQVMIRKGLMWDPETMEETESETRAEGKLNTPTYEGAYFIVTSDNVDLSNVKFDIAGNQMFIQADGRVDLPNVEQICIDKYTFKKIVYSTAYVTVYATATDGNFNDIIINDLGLNTSGGVLNYIEKQEIEIEDRDNDRIIIEVERGKIVKSVTINNEVMEVDGYTNRVEYELPHASTYTIEVECDIDENVVPEFIWVYNEELAEGYCNALKHARFEIISVTLPDGVTTYGVEDLGFEDTPGIGMHPIHNNAFVDENEEMGYGRLCAPAGSTIVIKVVPDEDYIVTSAGILGNEVFEEEEIENQYTFVMPDGERFFFDGTVEEDPNAEELEFADPNFYYFLLNNYDIDENGKITRNDMINLHDIYIGWNENINDISGIEQAVNLKTLSVYIDLENYEPITLLPNLETLNISNYKDKDVTYFKGINTLRNLSISSIEKDISLNEFNQYENLRFLAISMEYEKTVNLSGVELDNLETLYIWTDEGVELDCNDLSTLENLRYLSINKVNQINNVTTLNNLAYLQNIDIGTRNVDVATAMLNVDERIHVGLILSNVTEADLTNVINLFETSVKNNISFNEINMTVDLGNFETNAVTNIPFNDIFMYRVLTDPNSKFNGEIFNVYEYSDKLNVDNVNNMIEINTSSPGRFSDYLYINADYNVNMYLEYTVSYEGDTEEEIDISDESALEYLLREHDIDDNGKITEYDMINISCLEIDSNIRKLDWIKHAKNVEEITIITYNSNYDCSEINKLTKLKKVTIRGLVDYVLKNLNNPNIEKLTLYRYSGRTDEYNLDFLDTMPNLKELELNEINEISNLEKVKELAHLEKLDLKYTNLNNIPTFDGYDNLEIIIGTNRDLNRDDVRTLIEKYNNTPENVTLDSDIYVRVDLGAIGHESEHTFEEIMPLLPYLNDNTTKFGRIYGGNYYIEPSWGYRPSNLTINNTERKISINENNNGEYYAYLYWVCDERTDNFSIILNYTICDNPEEENEIIVIPDANLKAYLVEQFDVNGDKELSKFEMERITGFYSYNIDNHDVSDITGLEYATNLQYLALEYLHLTEFSALQRLDLSNIEYLPIDTAQHYIVDLGDIEIGTERKVEVPQLFRDALDVGNFLYDSNYKLEVEEGELSDDHMWFTIDTSDIGEYQATVYIQEKDYNQEIENNFDLSWSRLVVTYRVKTTAGDKITPINFNDENQENSLLEDYDIEGNGIITEHDMLNMGYLDLYNKNITDITGLEHAINCTEINLYNNNISDISPLMELSNLRWASLGNNNISDISCLKDRKFAPVTALDLEDNYLDFSNNSQTLNTYLEEMQKDETNGEQNEWLSMSIPFIASMATTQKIGNKQSMNQEVILDAKIKQKLIELGADANGDGKLTRQELYDATQYSYDEEYGYAEPKISELDLSNMNITNISGIEYLTNLRSLNLANNKIADFTPLSRMFNLSTLNLHNTGIADISIIPNAFRNYTEKLEMDFSNNKIQDISCLKNWAVSQTSAYIGMMAGGDVNQRVMNLNFANNQITDVSVINDLHTLAYIDLSNNRVKIISKLKDYNFLLNDFDDDYLYQENNGYKEQLAQFRGIDLSKNYIKTTSTHVLNSKAVFDNKNVMLKLDNQKAQPSQFLFDDVVKGDWYYDAVNYARQKGIMNGYTAPEDAGLFGPEDYITRGQIVTILYRLAGQPSVAGLNMDFSDVKNSKEYYYNPVKWAAANGIVTGYKSGPDQGKFKPNSPISREELAIVLQRYANYLGKNTSQTADLTKFGDYQLVSDWAVKSLKWAVGVGIISGNKDTAIPTIKPQGQATRAEAATMIMRFCENVIK